MEQSNHAGPPTFAVGYPQDFVKRIQGTPNSIVGNVWWYTVDSVVYDSVTFDSNGRVASYVNNSGHLKVR